jgi:nucleoid-associated protein YgaU
MFEFRLTPNVRSATMEDMSRTRVPRRRVPVVVTLGLVAALSGQMARALAPETGSRPVARHVYVVKAGDTVWSIATRLVGEADPRALVDAIGDRNHIDVGEVVPGQTLVIPSSP